MKKLSGIAAGLALAALVSQPLVASAAPAAADEGAWVNSAFGGLGPITSGAEMLTDTELESATGRIAPLTFAFAVATFDLTLMGLYWGVYVPNYGGGGSCSGCKSKHQENQ